MELGCTVQLLLTIMSHGKAISTCGMQKLHEAHVWPSFYKLDIVLWEDIFFF